MTKQRVMILLSLSCLLVIATAIGCGTAPGVNFLIPVGQSEFAFVVNSHPDSDVTGLTISAFTVNTSTGTLTAAPGSPFPTMATNAGGTLFIDVDPNSRFLYVPNRGADSVSVFSIASTGALSALGAPVPTGGSDAFSAKVTPNGQFLYVANRGSDDISAFSVSSAGALTAIGTPVSADGSPRHLFIDPQGRYLYASIWGEGYAVDGYKINTDGSLTYIPGAFVSTGKDPQSGTVDSTGKFLLVANRYSSNVSVYSIDQNTGDLSQVAGSPFTADSGPFHVVEFSVGTVVYMAVNNESAGTISIFTFNSTTGQMTPDGTPVDLGLSSPHYMAADSSGKFGYIADQGHDNIVGVTLNASGQPVAITGSPFTGGGVSAPSQIVLSH